MSENLSLTQLWARTNGIFIEPPIIYLRVQTDLQPVSFVPNQVWLASYEKLKDESGWRVGIWGNIMRHAAKEDPVAAQEIFNQAGLVNREMLKEGRWIAVPVVPPQAQPEANL